MPTKKRRPHARRTRQWICLVAFVCCLLIAILVPIVYFTARHVSRPQTPEPNWLPDCPAQAGQFASVGVPRTNCYPEPGVSKSRCQARGCCWIPPPSHLPAELKRAAPHCIYPKNYGYVVSGNEVQVADGLGWELPLTRLDMPSRYGNDYQNIAVQVTPQTSNRLRIKFYDPKEKRFEVPDPQIPTEKSEDDATDHFIDQLYAINYNKNDIPFSLRVRRVSSNVDIFDTSMAGFTFSDQFLQLTIRLPTRHLYGLGEHSHQKLRHDQGWKTWSLFAGDSKPGERLNGHGVHPVYLCMENDGSAHAVLLLNSYPIEVQMEPMPAITFRATGGILDFYIFLGPTPDDVMQQYTQAIGRPFMPPYWALGFNLVLRNLRDAEQGLQAIEFMKNRSLPFDSITVVSDTSSDPIAALAVSKMSNDLQQHGQRIILSIKPGVPIASNPPGFDDHSNAHVFINNSLGEKSLYGKNADGLVRFPDFGNNYTHRWWKLRLMNLYSDIKFDGLILDENEPYSLVNGSIDGCMDYYYNELPFVPRIKGHNLYENTICMDAVQIVNEQKLRHLQVHNLYGHSMLKTTARLLTSILKQRYLLISRSTFVGSGKYGGHSLTRYATEHFHINWSVYATTEFNLFGIPYVGAPVCGDPLATEERLKKDPSQRNKDIEQRICVSWFQLGMFYPFSQLIFPLGIQNSTFSNDIVIRAAQRALQTRYSLLPYLYTLFHYAHTRGSAVFRPLFYEFPSDNHSQVDNYQFMWGPALLISPILEPFEYTLSSFLPMAIWYDFYTGQRKGQKGNYFTVHYSVDRVNLHVRGGHIIPMHTSFNNTFHSRKDTLHLLVALDENRTASGSCYWDDGETRDAYKLQEYVLTTFKVVNDTLSVVGHKGKPILQSNFATVAFVSIEVFGLPMEPEIVTFGGGQLIPGAQVEFINQTLRLKDINIPITESVEIRWHWTRNK